MTTEVDILQKTKEAPTAKPPDSWLHQETWAASRARIQKEEKEMMARYFANHDFLLQEGANPAVDPRETAAEHADQSGNRAQCGRRRNHSLDRRPRPGWPVSTLPGTVRAH